MTPNLLLMYGCRLTLALAVLGLSPAASAQSRDGWLDLKLKPNTRLVVIDPNGRALKGKLFHLTTEAVVLQVESEQVTLGRDRVAIIRRGDAFDNIQTVYAPWENISRIGFGQRVRVYRSGGLMVEGTLAGRTDEGLRIESWDKTRFIERDKIRKVRILVKGHDDTAANIGATIGFLAGVAAIAAAASGSGEICDPAGALGGTTGLGALAAEGIASLFDRYETVYVARRP